MYCLYPYFPFLDLQDVIAEPVVTEEPFIPLTEEEEAEVASAFSDKNWYEWCILSCYNLFAEWDVNYCHFIFCRGRVLVTHENSNIDITGKVLQCLGPGKWLNDEVMLLVADN